MTTVVESAAPVQAALVVPLHGTGGDDRSLGGKAANLRRLARTGHAVPRGFCLTANAFRRHLAGDAEAAMALSALPDPDAAGRLRELTGRRPLPAEVADQLRAAVAELTGGAPLLAVRSSALDEDGDAQSFAGQHASVLGVAPDEVERAVLRCWASLWSDDAIAYRSTRQLPFDDLAMAVVVQALVPAELSAVAVTLAPWSGGDDVVVLNVAQGLGAPLVDGETSPDTLVFDRRSGSFASWEPGSGGRTLRVQDGAVGAAEEPRTGRPALTDAAARALVGAVLDAEAALGHAVDVEAAYAHGRWWLVQARPVTAA